MENNTSGQGKHADIPFEIQGWNWGAFLFTWVWGIGNNTYRAFWMFCPFVNLFMLVALGLKGNEWAWRNKRWESIEQFKQVQRKWTKASLIFIAAMSLFVLLMVFGIGNIFQESVPFQQSFRQVSSSPEVTSHLGTPLDNGFISGNIQTSGPDGVANLSYSISGPLGEATVAVRASMKLNRWSIECLVVDYEDGHDSTFIVPCQ